MTSASDKHLIQQIRGGDQTAWQELITRYEGRLLAFVERRLHDRSESEDIVQETFLGFYHSLPNFDDKRELQTYLFTIASYKLTDHLRRKGRHPLQHLAALPGDPLREEVDRHLGASTLARSNERRQLESAAVARCLGRLLKQWQDKGDYLRVKVLELLLVKGRANREVAAALGIGEQQVANYLFAAKTKLKEALRDEQLSPDVFPELYSTQ